MWMPTVSTTVRWVAFERRAAPSKANVSSLWPASVINDGVKESWPASAKLGRSAATATAPTWARVPPATQATKSSPTATASPQTRRRP